MGEEIIPILIGLLGVGAAGAALVSYAQQQSANGTGATTSGDNGYQGPGQIYIPRQGSGSSTTTTTSPVSPANPVTAPVSIGVTYPNTPVAQPAATYNVKLGSGSQTVSVPSGSNVSLYTLSGKIQTVAHKGVTTVVDATSYSIPGVTGTSTYVATWGTSEDVSLTLSASSPSQSAVIPPGGGLTLSAPSGGTILQVAYGNGAPINGNAPTFTTNLASVGSSGQINVAWSLAGVTYATVVKVTQGSSGLETVNVTINVTAAAPQAYTVTLGPSATAVKITVPSGSPLKLIAPSGGTIASLSSANPVTFSTQTTTVNANSYTFTPQSGTYAVTWTSGGVTSTVQYQITVG